MHVQMFGQGYEMLAALKRSVRVFGEVMLSTWSKSTRKVIAIISPLRNPSFSR